MRKVKWLIAAGLLTSVTACVETNGYPTAWGGGYPSGYGYYPSSSYYYSRPTYYQQPYYQPVQTRYVAVPQTRYVPVAAPVQRPYRNWRSSWGNRDSDGDGIPNRYDRDRNNDGIPDRKQRRGWW